MTNFQQIDIMNNMIIDNYNDAMALKRELSFSQMKGYHLLYRGHASNKFELVPIVGRKNPINGNLLDSEALCFNDYKNKIVKQEWIKYKVPSYNDDLFYMSIGRHLGLYCRLLDWTARLETALYFASSDVNCMCENGHLWIMFYRDKIYAASTKLDPFDTESVSLIKEDYITPDDKSINDFPLGQLRRFKQNGFFTIVPTNLLTTPLDKIPLNNMVLRKLEITANAKNDILSKLPKCYKDYLCISNSKIDTEINCINSMYFE